MTRLLLILALALAPPAFAQSVEDRIIAELVQDGYTQIRRSRTFLGRIRIVAVGNGHEREIVFNPANGLILRDYRSDGTAADDARSSGQGGGSGQTSGAGGGNDDDDDDGDDDNGGNGGDDDD